MWFIVFATILAITLQPNACYHRLMSTYFWKCAKSTNNQIERKNKEKSQKPNQYQQMEERMNEQNEKKREENPC